MPLSKSTRIIILLSIDSAFFLLELVVGMVASRLRLMECLLMCSRSCLTGYAVHSLALVADAFHMVSQAGRIVRYVCAYDGLFS